LIIAIILILKQATFLRVSNTFQSALSQAEQSYQNTNIDLKIQQYLEEFSPQLSAMKFLSFIMNTDIVSSQSSVKTSA